MAKFNLFLTTIILSIISVGSLMNISITNQIRSNMRFLPSNDVLHLLLYAALSYTVFNVITYQKKERAVYYSIVVGAALIVFGIFIEWFQAIYTTTRQAELIDILANISGVAIGSVACTIQFRVKRLLFSSVED